MIFLSFSLCGKNPCTQNVIVHTSNTTRERHYSPNAFSPRCFVLGSKGFLVPVGKRTNNRGDMSFSPCCKGLRGEII